MTYCVQYDMIITDRGDDMAKFYDENSRKRAQKYLKNNTFTASLRLNYRTEPELIQIYKQIPNKAQFIKDAIRKFAEDNGLDLEQIRKETEQEKSGE